mmetsp:Transcript_46937/g.114352  ORF Transcript_46937/g.114352 Transcript_46937/m.114352 type:complete len:242 (-) Transcript_46937:125-850(-)
MLPTPGSFSRRQGLPEYLRRALKYPQMDLEYTFWQMVYLCFDPKRVYKNTSYHKQTKNQWARDDPAFTVLCMGFLLVAAIAYCIAFQVSNPLIFLRVILGTVLVEFVVLGCAIATITWAVSNRYLRVHSLHSVEQEVEWLYAYDIHCNSFFPLFLLLYVGQYFMLPYLLQEGFLPVFLSNSLYTVAFVYYHYITFLGYSALPFLRDAVYFLYPAGVVIVLYVVTLLIGFNCTIFAINLHFL